MSLITPIRTGTKCTAVTVTTSTSTDGFILATGAKGTLSGMPALLQYHTLNVDRRAMDEAGSLDSFQFIVTPGPSPMPLDSGDVTFIKWSQDGLSLKVATSSGKILTLDQECRLLQTFGRNGFGPCQSLDILDDNSMVATFQNDSVGIVKNNVYNEAQRCQSPLHTVFLDENSWAVSTAVSKIHLYDSRTMKISASIRHRNQLDGSKPLKIRSIDVNRDALDCWLLASGDDDGRVSLWDRRNNLCPLLQTEASCKAGTLH